MLISFGYHKETINALDRGQDQGYVPNVAMYGGVVRGGRGIEIDILYDIYGSIRLIKIFSK
jgi:hypothetical protein